MSVWLAGLEANEGTCVSSSTRMCSFKQDLIGGCDWQVERQAKRERRQREHAQEQIRALMGEEEADAKTKNPKNSQMGAAASELCSD